jgi:hypothetical protein
MQPLFIDTCEHPLVTVLRIGVTGVTNNGTGSDTNSYRGPLSFNFNCRSNVTANKYFKTNENTYAINKISRKITVR